MLYNNGIYQKPKDTIPGKRLGAFRMPFIRIPFCEIPYALDVLHMTGRDELGKRLGEIAAGHVLAEGVDNQLRPVVLDGEAARQIHMADVASNGVDILPEAEIVELFTHHVRVDVWDGQVVGTTAHCADMSHETHDLRAVA